VSNRGRATIAREAWKPTCRSHLYGLLEIFQIHMDRCQRKQGHNGCCVGNFLVWDKNGVAQMQNELQGIRTRRSA
jgi:hypothetical protein